jgi:hypothetical protein
MSVRIEQFSPWFVVRSSPILKPNLNRPFRHVDLLSNAFAYICGGGGVLVEFDLERDELILCGPLSLLILLLLGECALAGWSSDDGMWSGGVSEGCLYRSHGSD